MTFSHQGTTLPISLEKNTNDQFILPKRAFFRDPVLVVLGASKNHTLSLREINETVAQAFGLDPKADYEFDKDLNNRSGLKAFYRAMSYIWKKNGHPSADGLFELPKRGVVKLSAKGLVEAQKLSGVPVVEEEPVVIEEEVVEVEEAPAPEPVVEEKPVSESGFDPTQGLKVEQYEESVHDDISRIQNVLGNLFSRENLRKILAQDDPQSAFIRVAAYIAQSGLLPTSSVKEEEPTEVEENLTAQWVAANPEILAKVRDKILGKPSLRQKMQHSIQLGLLEDHIQAWFTTAIANDSLGKVLRQGKPVKDYNIAAFIVKRAISYRRDMAQDPSCKALRGVTRKAERDEKAESNPTVHTSKVNNDPRVWNSDGDNGSYFLADFKDAKAATAIESGLIQEDLKDVILRTLLRKSPRTGNRLYGIFVKKSQGYTDREIAQEEGISINKARSLWAQAREHLQESQNVLRPLLSSMN